MLVARSLRLAVSSAMMSVVFVGGCSMLGGHSARRNPASKTIASTKKLSKDTTSKAVPSPLEQLDQRVTHVEGMADKMDNNTSATDMTVRMVRGAWRSAFAALPNGGESPHPCQRCKLHPVYASLKKRILGLHERLLKAEKELAKGCLYGFKNADGEVIPPNPDWSLDEFSDLRSKFGRMSCHL